MIDFQVTHLSDEESNLLLGDDIPPVSSAPKPSDIVINKKTEKEKEIESQENKNKNQNGKSNSEEDDEPLKVEQVDEEDEEELFSKPDDEYEEGDDKSEKGKVSTKTTSKKDLKDSVNYKEIANYLISKGYWKEIEDWDNIQDISEEDFLELTEAQDQARVSNKYVDLLDKTGPYGKAIIEFEKNGGNPSELIELFREQRDIINADIDTEEGQEEILRAYYESIGEDEESINDYIETAKDKGSEYFAKEAKKKQNRLLELNREESERIQQEQEENNRRQIEAQKMYEHSLRKIIHKELNQKESYKKRLEKFMLEPSYKLADGRQVNELFVKMIDIQKDPQKYIKFAEMILNFEDYDSKVSEKAASENAKKTFNIIKRGQSDKLSKTTEEPEYTQSKKTNPFRLIN